MWRVLTSNFSGSDVHRRAALKLTIGAAAAAVGELAGAGVRASSARAAGRVRVVVIGGGFAGAACALYLRALDSALEIELVDPDRAYVTCPMSNGALVGLRTLDTLTVSRSGLERHGVRVIRDRAVAIDADRRKVRLGSGPTMRYDRLVFAAGIRFLWGRPQGYTEAVAAALPHAWQAGPQTLLLAAQIAGVRTGGVVAISVPAGPMRCPPGPFERASLIAGYLKRRNPRAKVMILDANNHFPKQDVFTDAWQDLYPGMIDWIPVTDGGAIERVDPSTKTLYTSQGAVRADVINIIPPQAPAQLAVEAGLASDHGWCPIDPDGFLSALLPNVHVIGDACISDPMPKAASSANAQAKRCARAIALALRGRETRAEPLESVCYSLLAADRALSIHARFEIAGAALKTVAATPSEPQSPAPSAAEAQNAARWYAGIVADSFGEAGAPAVRP
jgi:NADPH-dependent 2,4-dienoyl-CoA reductase/sulfur reductase-like enzyme